jgi:plastocyanin
MQLRACPSYALRKAVKIWYYNRTFLEKVTFQNKNIKTNIMMDTKTKINTVISIVLVSVIALLAYWVQLPTEDLKAQVIGNEIEAEVIETDTSLIRIQDFAFDPDVMRIDANTTVSWLHDESEANSDVQHTITSYDPDDVTTAGDDFESDLLSLGDTFSNTFEEPGVYYYNCSLYPFMTGKICVGEESEELDDDCVIDVSGRAEESVIIADVEEEIAEEEVSDETLEEGEEISDEILEETLEEDPVLNLAPAPVALAPESTDTLYPAADPNYDGDNGEAVFQEPEATPDYGTPRTELAQSGPEEIMYVFLLMASFFLAKQITSKSQG